MKVFHIMEAIEPSEKSQITDACKSQDELNNEINELDTKEVTDEKSSTMEDANVTLPNEDNNTIKESKSLQNTRIHTQDNDGDDKKEDEEKEKDEKTEVKDEVEEEEEKEGKKEKETEKEKLEAKESDPNLSESQMDTDEAGDTKSFNSVENLQNDTEQVQQDVPEIETLEKQEENTDSSTTHSISVAKDVSSDNVSDQMESSSLETSEKNTKKPDKDVSLSSTVQISNTNDQESSEDGSTENPVFVHVNTETEKDDSERTRSDGDRQDEEDFHDSQPQEDPIPSDDFAPVQLEEESEDVEQAVDEEQGANEELCIIPDTERIISQEEKDAAAAIPPLRDIAEDTKTTEESGGVRIEESSETPIVEKYTVSLCTDDNVYKCRQCRLIRKPQFLLKCAETDTYICDDRCFKEFKSLNKDKEFVNDDVESDLRIKNLSSGEIDENMVPKVNFLRKCIACEKDIVDNETKLSWETMEFCNESCLSKYQKKIGSKCANCQVNVRSNCLGKYCVRFGYDIRQFCSGPCLEEYKKGLKVCSYCQKDMSGGGDGFLAPVGDKGQFKDFCTQQCMEKYDIMSNNRDQSSNSTNNRCSVCLEEKPTTIEYEHDNKKSLFCGEPCFVAFKFVNNITPGKCDMCRKYFDNKLLEQHAIFYDNAQHSFCSKSCQNIYIIAHRKIVPCSWCKVKKYNFDMIKRSSSDGQVLMMCSLNCLSLYQVSINAVHSKKVKCDHCQKYAQPMYHLTMSDATLRNFCSYTCVMIFQSQFSKTITFNEPEEQTTPVPTSAPKKSKKVVKTSETPPIPADVPTIPVITSVQSLATTNGPTTPSRTSRNKNGTESPVLNSSSTKTQIKQHVIFKPSPLPPQRNVSTMCKVIQSSKAVSCRPNTANKEVQTEEVKDKTAIIPIPVPIYVPSPMWMYSMPFPVPFPVPLPVPVPIFIPTTRNSANGIMKEIKKIQVKIPTDPFEAELLMMAEMVAGDKKEEHTDSESEEDDNAAAEEGTFSPEPVDPSNTFGDDMLQMALKMATELDEPAVDLEGALTASTITASQGAETTGTEESVDDPQPIHHMMERQTVRGRKRPGRPPRNASSKRGRRSSNQMDIPLMAPPQPPPPSEPVEKPDANMCLKYTFGVNAWKQWVTTKNAELEKSTRRMKLFKPEILQLTADELNYSLCLFVKEVRKPNGQEYAPDTIYYLCLGIQQYLFENGRIDNIFCDTYYEKFTDCLDEVAKKFSVLYNDSHYIVTRVEEEHLWESKQLGAHSPHVLLSTLMFFNTKHFNLTSVDEHMQLSFSHIMKHWKRNPNQPGTNKVAGSRNVLLRFYPPQNATDNSARKKKVYEQQENEENPLRCPVKLYEFYLSKCPESVKTRNDVFYLLPERSCVPDSPVWYSTMPLPKTALEKMLHRVKMVKEINVALLTS